jgi:dolichyl-phosphate-mannose-protein mannosyltransferase
MSGRRRVTTLLLLLICAVALGLRLLAITFGLPATYNPDEMPILNRALAFAKGDFNPHNFLYPSLYFYALFAWEVVFFVLGRVAGLYHSVDDFQREFFTDPSRLFVAGRLLTTCVGVATVPALYVFGKRLYNATTGLAAAAFLAVAPVAVRDAHYVKLDVPVTLLVVLTHVAVARIVTEPLAAQRRASWAIAGLFAGLTISTHYYAAFIVLPIAAAAAVEGMRTTRWTDAAISLGIAAVATIAGFIIGTPFFFAEPHTALRDIVAVREIDIDRAVQSTGAFTSFARYAEILFRDATGWPVCLLGAVGFIWAVLVDWRRGLILGTFTATFLVFVSNTVPMSRYLNVVIPLFALAAAFTVTMVSERFGRRAPAAAAVLTLAAMLPGLTMSVRTDRFFRQRDTRTIAREYIEQHIPSGSTILVQPYSAPVRRSRESLVEALRANLGSEQKASIKFQLMLAAPVASPSYRLIYLGEGGEDPDKIYSAAKVFDSAASLAPIRALGVQYVVLKQGNMPNPGLAALESALAREGRRIASFTPYRAEAPPAERARVAPYLHNTAARIEWALERPGPGIDIWDIQLDRTP